MQKMLTIVPVLAVLALVVAVQADGEKSCCSQVAVSQSGAADGCSGGDCAAGACCASACKSAAGCPIAAAMERLPKLTYAVGEKSTCCPQEAAELAKASSSQVHFCVADKKFDSESDAQAALIEATESFVATFTKPHTCPQSGQVTLAGQVQTCENAAAQTAQLMQQAMDQVKVAYVVGERECNCPVEAAKVAKESGQELQYVVGTEKTCCEKAARLNLARAKYKAAVEALVKTQSATAKPTTNVGT